MLSVKGLCTDYPGERGQAVRAARDVSFEVPAGKLFTLLGPSGCGKTTTLRSIAGLERPAAGEIRVGNELVFSRDVFIPPNRRGLGMVFQTSTAKPWCSWTMSCSRAEASARHSMPSSTMAGRRECVWR